MLSNQVEYWWGEKSGVNWVFLDNKPMNINSLQLVIESTDGVNAFRTPSSQQYRVDLAIWWVLQAGEVQRLKMQVLIWTDRFCRTLTIVLGEAPGGCLCPRGAVGRRLLFIAPVFGEWPPVRKYIGYVSPLSVAPKWVFQAPL